MSSEFAVRVFDVSKCYHLYDVPVNRLWQALFRGRRKLYHEFWALRGVSFDVRRGETFGVVGKNGSGKSTILQIICDTLRPTSGSVERDGKIAALLELGAGFNPEYTGRQNALLSGAIYGLTAEQVNRRLPQMIAFAEIGEFIDRPVKTYSSGMFVRLAFAVIAHVDADILVIDEALAVGDAQFTQKCMRFLRAFKERGTLIFVSHDTGAVRSLCDRAVWLDGGQVHAEGSAKDVTEKYLASLFNQSQSGGNAPPAGGKAQRLEWLDQRRELLMREPLRNDIQVFTFEPGRASSFGVGGVRLCEVRLEDSTGRPLSWVVGGEIVRLCIDAIADVDLDRPIVGFFMKDKLGQTLFGDNTFLAYVGDVPALGAGQHASASFSFPMPILPAGDYSFDIAIADGTQAEHRQHYWGHDVLIIRSISSSVSTGLLGIPMLEINLDVHDEVV